jgi:hypothetical protein
MDFDTVVFGIYQRAPQLDGAVEQLPATGFDGASIFTLFPRNKETAEFAERKQTHVPAGTVQQTGCPREDADFGEV